MLEYLDKEHGVTNNFMKFFKAYLGYLCYFLNFGKNNLKLFLERIIEINMQKKHAKNAKSMHNPQIKPQNHAYGCERGKDMMR